MVHALVALAALVPGLAATIAPPAATPAAPPTPPPPGPAESAKSSGQNPWQLAIGRPGQITAPPGLTDLRTGEPATLDDLVRASADVRFILVGESHDNAAHHQFQADVLRALAATPRPLLVGFEQFTFPRQRDLNAWTLGEQTEEEFITASQWKTEWGFDFGLYRPIFQAVRDHRLPMVALNVPRTWVRAVGRGGVEALPPEAYGQVPPLELEQKNHLAVFQSLIGGHPLEGVPGRRMYTAQVLWDEAMADRALRAFARRPGTRAAMVILAGNGHVMYDQGIGLRLTRRTGERVLTIVCLDKDAPSDVARGLADFVYRPE